MSSHGWSIVGDLVNVETAIATIMGGVATTVYQKLSSTSDTDLEDCRKALEDIKSRLNELSPDRRRRIDRAAAEGDCTSLETLEEELQRLLEDRCWLVNCTEQSTFLERHLPSALSGLRTDISVLKDAIRALWLDSCKTTTYPRKEDRGLTQTQPQQPESSSRPRRHSTTANTSTRARVQPFTPATQNSRLASHGTSETPHSSRQLEEHPLVRMPPMPAHVVERHGAIQLPPGLV